MGRIGIFYNNKWLQLVSQFSYISQSNNNGMQQFTQVGTNETITANTLYDIATTGWTTDIVLTPAKGLGFHGLLTL